ncbi:MAG: Re/Si-specific NAD(P)(+) transhydrogenase subunit alpha [Dehalococcoidia bacterium]
MIVGVPSETYPEERRVALIPRVIPSLVMAGLEVWVERGGGAAAGFPDVAYEESGARLANSDSEVFSNANVILQVRCLGVDTERGYPHLDLLHPDQLLIGLLDPLGRPQVMPDLASRRVSAMALELVPRVSRAQPMDVLTSMATVSGYKAVLVAADRLPKMFPMLMTAAGTVTPAHVLVVGAGVAGLQAIATARRLGAVVQAYDVRPMAKEQVESLGAKFLELPLEAQEAESSGGYARQMDEQFYRRQREMMSGAVARSDVVITTAAVPGKRAPLLITDEMVQQMPSGSLIVDLAAESGGNCQLTKPGETVQIHDVTILGPLNLPSTVPYHASQMYASNISAFLLNMVKDGQVNFNMEDPIVSETLVVHRGEIVNPKVREMLGLPTEAQVSTNGSDS